MHAWHPSLAWVLYLVQYRQCYIPCPLQWAYLVRCPSATNPSAAKRRLVALDSNERPFSPGSRLPFPSFVGGLGALAGIDVGLLCEPEGANTPRSVRHTINLRCRAAHYPPPTSVLRSEPIGTSALKFSMATSGDDLLALMHCICGGAASSDLKVWILVIILKTGVHMMSAVMEILDPALDSSELSLLREFNAALAGKKDLLEGLLAPGEYAELAKCVQTLEANVEAR